VAKDKGKDKPAEDAGADAEVEGAEAVEGEEGAEVGKKKLPLKMILIAGAAAFVVLGGGGGAAFFFLAPKPDAAHSKKKPAKSHGSEKKGEGKDDKGGAITDGPDGVVFYSLPDMVVNMQTADGKPTFLKLKLTLEVADRETAEAIQPEMPRLTDMFQTFLRELRPEDL